MEISYSNSLNIQLASFAKALEKKVKKKNEDKQSEYMKINEFCQTKEKPLTISSLYHSGPSVSSTCNECHPAITSLFQKSFSAMTLKDLLHKCKSNIEKVKPCKQELQSFHQCSLRGSVSYYFMRVASWMMYQVFSCLYKGFLVHQEHIQCIKQAQDTGSSILFISSPNPDLRTLCSIYFALYYSGLRLPEISGFAHLSWYSRFLFSCMGSLKHGTDPVSIITHTVGPHYMDYVNFTIDDIYVVPVAVSFDKFIHVNLATPYALSELEIKYSTVELDESDVDDIRDIDYHIQTDCSQHIPLTATCFVAYVLLASRTGNVIQKDRLLQCAHDLRGEFIREKVGLNFKGKTEDVVNYSLKLFKSYMTSRKTCDGKVEFVLTNVERLVDYAMGLIMKKLLLCVVTCVVYSIGGAVVNRMSGKIFYPAHYMNSDEKTECHFDGERVDVNILIANSKLPFSVQHKDIVCQSLALVEKVESKLKTKLFKYCQTRDDEINKIVDVLSDCEILNSTNKALLEEERWCQNMAKSFDIETEDGVTNTVDKRSYNVEALERSPVAKSYINIMSSLNDVFIEETANEKA